MSDWLPRVSLKRALTTALLGLAVTALPIDAQESTKRLTGTYAVGGRTLIDPPAGEAKNTHLYVVLDGSAARDVYRAMSARAVRDACLDDGSFTKTLGAMQCTENAKAKRYTCAFAINLTEQKIEAGAVC